MISALLEMECVDFEVVGFKEGGSLYELESGSVCVLCVYVVCLCVYLRISINFKERSVYTISGSVCVYSVCVSCVYSGISKLFFAFSSAGYPRGNTLGWPCKQGY